jgi:hypothetical protein
MHYSDAQTPLAGHLFDPAPLSTIASASPDARSAMSGECESRRPLVEPSGGRRASAGARELVSAARVRAPCCLPRLAPSARQAGTAARERLPRDPPPRIHYRSLAVCRCLKSGSRRLRAMRVAPRSAGWWTSASRAALGKERRGKPGSGSG